MAVVQDALRNVRCPVQMGAETYRMATAKVGHQEWIITDVVGCPMSDVANGPLAQLNGEGPWLSNNIHFTVEKDRVNAFACREMIKKHKPNIIVAFGTWRNVLVAEYCEGMAVDAQPTGKDRKYLQGPQCNVFQIGEEFLQAVASAVLAQSACSFLLVGPKRYLWRCAAKVSRPQLRFWLPEDENQFDYYQGAEKMTKHEAVYWPSGPQMMPTIDERGAASMLDILAKHERVMVISAGRGVFWTNAMEKLRSKRLCPANDVSWGLSNLEWLKKCRREYRGQYGCRECRPWDAMNPQLCMNCLKAIKKWAEIDEKQYMKRSADVAVQTEEPENIEFVKPEADVAVETEHNRSPEKTELEER